MAKGIAEEYGNEKDAAYDKLKAKQEHSDKARGVLRGAGYARGGGVSPAKAVHKHETHLHKGQAKTKLKQGGKVDGKKAHPRADKFARGGKAPHGKHTKININVGAGEGEKRAALQQGMQLGARMASAARPGVGAPMQARGPMPGAAPAGGPMGGGVPPTMQKSGGRAYAKGGKVGPVRVAGTVHLPSGAGGGEGRLAKVKQYGTKPKK